ncbi:MAG: CaiB/BaiF CoA-transferase family protein [Cyclobacteriaceae bacterium]
MDNMTAPLEGYRVLELASVLAGPAVGQFLAECGAQVVKVESLPAGGDMTRQWKLPAEPTEDDRSAYFTAVNWGKSSLAVDLRHREGRQVIYDLVRQSDIVISSYTDSTAAKLGMAYDTLKQHREDIIFGRITGFGEGEERPAFDALVQAEAGFMYMNGQPGGPSTKMPVALMDLLAAHQLKEGILLALLRRGKTGKGSKVEVSLIDAALSSLANQATNWLVAGHIPEKEGSRHPNIAPYGDTFITGDGKEIILAVGTDRQFASLCQVLDLQHLADSPHYTTNTLRVANRAKLVTELSPAFSRFDGEELVSQLTQNRVPSGIVRKMPEVMEKYGKGRVLTTGKNDVRNLSATPQFVAKIFGNGTSSHTVPHIAPPPSFGEHSRIILQKMLGYSSQHYSMLKDKNIIK